MNDIAVKDGRVVEVITERLGSGQPLNQLLFVAADDDQETSPEHGREARHVQHSP